MSSSLRLLPTLRHLRSGLRWLLPPLYEVSLPPFCIDINGLGKMCAIVLFRSFENVVRCTFWQIPPTFLKVVVRELFMAH